MKEIVPVDLSRGFVVAVCVLAAYAMMANRMLSGPRLPSVRLFGLFLALVIIHTVICYGVAHVGEIDFRDVLGKSDGIGTVESPATRALRLAILVIFWRVVSKSVRGPADLLWPVLAYGLGFITTIVFGASNSEWLAAEGLETRANGGFDNPNTFGISGVTLLFLVGMALSGRRNNRPVLAGLLVLGCTAAMGIFTSGSRTAMLGAALGVAVVTSLTKRRYRLTTVLLALLLVSVTFFAADDAFKETFRVKWTGSRIGGTDSIRLAIWSDYLSNFSSYALTGVGFGRSTVVTEGWYSTTILYYTHNTYLGVVVEYGVAALVLLLAAQWRLAKELIAAHKTGRSLRAAVLLGGTSAWILMCQFGNLEPSRDLWLCFAIIIGSLDPERYCGPAVERKRWRFP